MTGKLKFLPLVLAAAAIAAPLAQARPVDPLAQGAAAAAGLSPSQVHAWTQGVCSYTVKPASCYLTPAQSRAASVSLGRALLGSSGLSASEINAWTQGVCSYQAKPSSCYLTPAQASAASQREAVSLGAPTPGTGTVEVIAPSGFSWGDAAIGAAIMTGLFLIGAAGAMFLRRRRVFATG